MNKPKRDIVNSSGPRRPAVLRTIPGKHRTNSSPSSLPLKSLPVATKPRGLVGNTLQWIATDVLVLRDQDPIALGNLGYPLDIRHVARKMIEVNFDIRPGCAKHFGDRISADLVVQKEGE